MEFRNPNVVRLTKEELTGIMFGNGYLIIEDPPWSDSNDGDLTFTARKMSDGTAWQITISQWANYFNGSEWCYPIRFIGGVK